MAEELKMDQNTITYNECGAAGIPFVDHQGRELTEHGSAAFPVGCYYDNLSVGPVAWHWHDELEVVVIESGTAEICVGTERYLCKAGDGFFINSGVLHACWQAEDRNGCGSAGDTGNAERAEDADSLYIEACHLHSLVFHPRLVGGSIDSIFWQKYVQPVLADSSIKGIHFRDIQKSDNDAIQAIEQAWQSCAKKQPGYELNVRNQLSGLMNLILNRHSFPEKQPSEKALRDGERIKKMLQFIQENYAEELSVERIAKCATISESECLRCFRSMIGTTPIQYVKQFRVQRAAELLLDTELKISDIGAQCGFQEMSYFARAFRQVQGCTPGEYRRRAQEEKL